jgi:hypothetical protein
MAKLNWDRVAKDKRDLQAHVEGLPHSASDEQRRQRPLTNKAILYQEGLRHTNKKRHQARVKGMNFRPPVNSASIKPLPKKSK